MTLKPLFPPEWGIDTPRSKVIAGPCSAETLEQTLTTAVGLSKAGIRLFRAGLWKPRTHPGGFEGVGAEGLPWLRRVKEATGMLTATEVATRAHVEAALRGGVDVLWIGARTSANPFAMQEIAEALAHLGATDVPVLVKNPVNPDLELWIGALQRLNNAGVQRLGAIHRGFSSWEPSIYRNPPRWRIPIELRRRVPGLPVFIDPSHMGGKRELVGPISQTALDMGFEGLVIESHCNPDCAWSDKAQQVEPETLSMILDGLVARPGDVSTESIDQLRRQIDRLDQELIDVLARRMEVACEIGRYKKEREMPIVQAGRYDDIMQERSAQARSLGMSPEFMRAVFEAIHEESVRRQLEVYNAR